MKEITITDYDEVGKVSIIIIAQLFVMLATPPHSVATPIQIVFVSAARGFCANVCVGNGALSALLLPLLF